MTRLLAAALLVLLLAPPSPAGAREVKGVTLPEQWRVGDTVLALRGAGVRRKWLLSLYVAGLYLPPALAAAGPDAVIAADAPMALRLVILSGLITPKKMEHAVREGFDRATGGRTGPLVERIEQFLAVFRAGVHKGDRFDLVYRPGQGVAVLRDGRRQRVIPGLDFKRALFGIWLSERPVQASLKRALLGQAP